MENLINISERKNMDKDKALDTALAQIERSFGKGLVQQTRKLSYNAQLKLTVAKYYIPSGRCIQSVNYNNRNDDGSIGKVPDSLKTEFPYTPYF